MSANTREIIEAAEAIVARWYSPKWKDEPHTAVCIERLRAALAAKPAPQPAPQAHDWQSLYADALAKLMICKDQLTQARIGISPSTPERAAPAGWKRAAEYWYGEYRQAAFGGQENYPVEGALDCWFNKFTATAPSTGSPQ